MTTKKGSSIFLLLTGGTLLSSNFEHKSRDNSEEFLGLRHTNYRLEDLAAH